MAKNETKVAQKSNKPKGKKRKQPVEEAVETEKIYLSPSRKASKRKSNADTIKPKKHKATSPSPERTNSDDELRQPTLEQLKASERPENTLSIETIRQKKKKSHHENVTARLENSSTRESERNEQYLKKWKNSRSEWKFEKLRQISIQTTVLDETKIDDELFAIALDYLSGAKGAARDFIVKQAEEVINKLDDEITNEQNKDDVIKMSRYKRARELLQLLQ